MDKYRLVSLISSAAVAVVCFYAYFWGGARTYPISFLLAGIFMAAAATAEVMSAKKRGATGALSYLRPSLFYLLALGALGAAAYLFLS